MGHLTTLVDTNTEGKSMRKLLLSLLLLGIIGLGIAWFVTAPKREDPTILAGLEPDMARGEWVFHASGCASCHSAPGAEGEAKLVLTGGKGFASPFGTFYAPNISPDPNQGIGNWSALDLLNAMRKGVSPEGKHYYPAFPYTSYAKADPADVVSLHAYLASLPASTAQSKPHDVGFPFNIRRTLGGWKFLFLKTSWQYDGDMTDETTHGRYLVEALGHCSECHTPRNVLGGLQTSLWMSGAPSPDGKGKIPGIHPQALDWSASDIAEYLKSGFTPEYDVAGGEMTDVIENTSKLSDEDRAAIAAYIKALP